MPQDGECRRLAQSGQDHAAAEIIDDALEDGLLQRFFGAEVTEQATLRHAGELGEPADAQSFEALDAAERNGVAQDGGAGGFAFAHGPHRYERSFFCVKEAQAWSARGSAG